MRSDSSSDDDRVLQIRSRRRIHAQAAGAHARPDPALHELASPSGTPRVSGEDLPPQEMAEAAERALLWMSRASSQQMEGMTYSFAQAHEGHLSVLSARELWRRDLVHASNQAQFAAHDALRMHSPPGPHKEP